MAVPGAFPAVAGDLICASRTAGGQHDRARVEHLEPAALALVANDARRTAVGRQQTDDGEFHVDVDAAVHPLILQRSNQLEPGAIADVRESRIAMPAEVALQDPAVGRPIKNGPPRFELAD